MDLIMLCLGEEVSRRYLNKHCGALGLLGSVGD